MNGHIDLFNLSTHFVQLRNSVVRLSVCCRPTVLSDFLLNIDNATRIQTKQRAFDVSGASLNTP